MRGDRGTLTREEVSTLIIGAGPYGVSVALALHAGGLPFTIVGRPFELWFEHTLDGIRLRSDWPSSGIPSPAGVLGPRTFWEERLGRGARPPAGRVAVEDFRAYLGWVRTRLPFPILEDHVARLEPTGPGFRARTEQGAVLEAERVVLATGLGVHRYLPAFLQSLPPERVIHSFEVARYRDLSGERVLVVGGGQSAAEATLHLVNRNEVTWHHAGPVRFRWLPLDLPRPAYAALLRGAGLVRHFPVSLRARLRRALAGASITPDLREALDAVSTAATAEVSALRAVNGALVDGAGRRYNRIVACTGYRPAWDRLSFVDARLVRRLEAGPVGPVFDTAVPGCFAVGKLAESTFGPAMGFLIGCRRTARAFRRRAEHGFLPATRT